MSAAEPRTAPRPSGADWLHRWLVLPVGEGKYRFRTLSLYDVSVVWPHLVPIYEATVKHRPLAFNRELMGVLEHLCPGITKGEDWRTDKFTGAHIDAIKEFYEQQDWGRIKALGDGTGATAEALASEKPTQSEADRNFYLLCVAGARSSGMSVTEFVQERFEFCADVILNLHAEFKQVQEAAGANGTHGGQFLAAAGAMLGDALSMTKLEPGDPKPGWMMEIEEKMKDAN